MTPSARLGAVGGAPTGPGMAFRIPANDAEIQAYGRWPPGPCVQGRRLGRDREGAATVGMQRVAALACPARRHQPGGEQRTAWSTRDLARRRRYAFVRETWVTLVTTLLVTLAALLTTGYLVLGDVARGVLVAVGLVGVLSAMAIWIGQASGTAPSLTGDLGEQWTAHELRKLRRHGWVVVTHVSLRMRDIDHLLIGPGGVIAVQAKWSATAWTWHPIDQRIFDTARQAQALARDLSSWDELRSLGVRAVDSAVFLWGPGAHKVPCGAAIEETAVVTRRTATWWRRGLGHDRLSPEQVERAWRAVDTLCRSRERSAAQSTTMPASPGEWLARMVFAVVAVCAGVLAITSLVATDLQWALSLAWWLLILAVSLAASRLGGVRYLGAAWVVGLGAVGLLAAATVVTLSI